MGRRTAFEFPILKPQAQIWVKIDDIAPGGVAVSVVDNGCGLQADTAARMLEPLFTARAAGLGLGLGMVKCVVEAHEGRLWSEPGPCGCGMALTFTLLRQPQP